MALNVDKGVLIPRPETEILVEKICKIFQKSKSFYFRRWNWFWLYYYFIIKRA